MAHFTKARFQARLYGLCWTILETRQPNFDAEKAKGENMIITILQSVEYATDEEKEVIKQLTEVMKSKPDVSDDLGAMQGALEGKNIIYKKLSPHLLLEEKDLTGIDQSSNSDKLSAGSKSCLIPLAILLLVIIGFSIYNSDACRERRAYRAITKTKTIFEEKEAVRTYIADFPRGKHAEDVYYRSARLNSNDAFYITRYLNNYPFGTHYAEVKQIYDDCLYNDIVRNWYKMSDIMAYLNKFPKGTHAAQVNQWCDSLWDVEIAKYHAQPKTKKATKATQYLDAMLEYMKIQRVNTLILITESKYNLKDYTEYSQTVREYIENYNTYKKLPVKGNVISLKYNFSAGSQSALNQILSHGLQASFDSIFTPGFIEVSDNALNERTPLPHAVFNYEIKSQEDDIWGEKYPHLWIYTENNVPKKYLIGISITCHVKFTIPNSDVMYELFGKGAPEKDIRGIRDVSDGYRQMTIMSFARFSNDLYAKFGLKEVY